MKNSKKLKVLILSHMYPNNINPNYGTFIHNQVKRLASTGCDTRVISPVPYAPKLLWFNHKWRNFGEIPQFDIIDEVPVYYPRYITPPGQWFHGISGYSIYKCIKNKVDSIFEEFTPNIIHTHTATPDGYAGLLLKRRYKIPFICSLRGSDINYYPFRDKLTMALTKTVLSKADQIVSVSHALRKTAEAIEKPLRPIRVLHNGCDFMNFSFKEDDRLKTRKDIGVLNNEKVIIFVGALMKDKGVYELINAFRKIISKYPAVHLILLGSGPEDKIIKRVILENRSDKKIHLIGRRPHDEVVKWLKSSDLFVLPTYNEGLPNALLEAMACGLPVIASNVGGIPEVVTDGENGILIDAKNIDALYQAIDYMLPNDNISKSMGNKGKELIENKFTWENNAKNMTDIYESLISIN